MEMHVNVSSSVVRVPSLNVVNLSIDRFSFAKPDGMMQ